MNDVSSLELAMASNSSFPRSLSARGEEVEVDGERAARNSTVAASSSVTVAMTGESKGDDATGDGSVEIRSAAVPDLPGGAARGSPSRSVHEGCEYFILTPGADEDGS